MIKTPFFSVILNTHNADRTIIRTINSVLNQSFRDFELIVIDDYSTDNTLALVHKQLEKCEIQHKIISLKENKGISYSRNIGIKEAQGKYVAFIDDDDLWNRNKLQEQFTFLSKNDFLVDWIFSNYCVIDSNYKKIGIRRRKSGFYDWRSMIRNGNPVGMLTVVIKSKVAKENKFRNVKHEDYDLWIRLSKKGIAGYLMKDELAKYMKHKSISSNKFKSIVWTYQVFRLNGISFNYSIYLLLRYIINYFSRSLV